MKELSRKDIRRVWAIAKELFLAKSWTMAKSIEDFRVSDPLLRELRLSKNRELLLTDAGLAGLRATVVLLEELDPSDGLAGYSDFWSACREVLEACLSNGVEPQDGSEYMSLLAARVGSRIAVFNYIVPVFGAELEAVDGLILGSLTVNHPSKALIDGLGLQYSAEHLEMVLAQTKQHLWIMGAARGTSDRSRERFIERCRLACGLLAVYAASTYMLGSHGFRIGVITTPEEDYGRALSLSWRDKDLELRVTSKSVRAQRFKVNLEVQAAIIESAIGRRAIEILESENRNLLEETWVRALFWYSDAHRDQAPVMRFLKFWSCVEAFFSASDDITESVSFGLAASVVYGDVRSPEPPEFLGLKKRLKNMYGQRSRATHGASYSHVSEKDVADLSQWIAWMLLSMLAFSCRGITSPSEVGVQLTRRAEAALK